MTRIAWQDDEELFRVIRAELCTAVVGDVLDTMGLLRQFLPATIQPLRSDMVVLGRAMPVLQADIDSDAETADLPAVRKPFGLMLEALDDLKPQEVYVATGGSKSYALWGEIMSTRAMRLNGAGAVLDGYSRDTRGILALNFPTFSRGRFAQDQRPRGQVVDFRAPIGIEDVRVCPGDVVFGDLDGVLVIPRSAEHEAFMRALEKARKENAVKRAVEEGMSSVDAFARFGVM